MAATGFIFHRASPVKYALRLCFEKRQGRCVLSDTGIKKLFETWHRQLIISQGKPGKITGATSGVIASCFTSSGVRLTFSFLAFA
jgi:hypothetical protein